MYRPAHSRRTPGFPGALPACANMSWLCAEEKRLQPIEDLVGPETLEAMQRLVQHGELVRRDAADLLDRAHVLLVERAHRLAHVAALFGQLDANRAAIDARALVIEEAHFDELLQIVRHVRAEIVA